MTSSGTQATAAVLSVEDLRALVGVVAEVPPAASDREQVDQLEALERLKSAAAAAQANITLRLAEVRTIQADARAALAAVEGEHGPGGGLPPLRRPRPDAGTAQEVALARRESPHHGRRHLALARALTDLPATYAALARGDLSEHRAQTIADEIRDLTRADRLAVDTELADHLPFLGDRQLLHTVRRVVHRIDEDGVLRRRAAARARRRVTTRQLGDGLTRLTALVTDLHAAAIMASLAETVDTRHAMAETLDEDRTRGQLLADTFVERLTGLTMSAPIPVALKVVVSAETLLDHHPDPGEVPDLGPLPASIVRHLAGQAGDHPLSTWQRLFATPDDGTLVALERTSRGFPPDLREALEVRDRSCRTPWCDAPARHADHVHPHHAGGPTSLTNGQAMCEACNHAKETPGWRHQVTSTRLERHQVETRTPTGHRHRSTAPALPRPGPAIGADETRRPTRLETYLAHLVLTA